MPQSAPYILLIDDDCEDLEMLSSTLEELGITTQSFVTGESAKCFMLDASSLPSMIIVDYNMPQSNGQQVLISLKNNIVTRNIPIVVYSTFMSKALKMTLTGLGAYDCFTKSFSCDDLDHQAAVFKRMANSFT